MRNAIKTLVILLPMAMLLACGGEKEPRAPGEQDDPQEKKAGAADGKVEPSPPGKGGEAAATDTAAGAAFLTPGSGVPADHKPIGAEDREVLSSVYLSFAEDPEGFVEQVQQLDPDRRKRIAGYLLCASTKLHAAGNPAQAGAPARIELPLEAQELIRYQGPPERGRTLFLRQLGGEFLIVGRSIQSIDQGDTRTVEQILVRQQQNLELMKVSHGPDEAAQWSATMRRVFPILFAKLIPEC